MMKKWRVLGLIAAMGAVLAVSGCGDKQATGAKGNAAKKATDGLVLGFAHCCERGQIRTMDAVEDVIRQEAEKAGVTMLFETSEETKHVVKGEDGKDQEMDDYYTIQPVQMKKLIDAGAKAIILITVQGKDEEKMQAEMLNTQKKKAFLWLPYVVL